MVIKTILYCATKIQPKSITRDTDNISYLFSFTGTKPSVSFAFSLHSTVRLSRTHLASIITLLHTTPAGPQ